MAKDAFKDTLLHDQCVVRNIELFRGGEREQYTIDDEGKLVFKEGVETIKPVEEDDKDKIKEVVINEGAKVIGKSAFMECGELAAVSVPSTVVEIGSWAFGE
jgi:hypothetical protein